MVLRISNRRDIEYNTSTSNLSCNQPYKVSSSDNQMDTNHVQCLQPKISIDISIQEKNKKNISTPRSLRLASLLFPSTDVHIFTNCLDIPEREYICQEIIKTEEIYVKELKIVLNSFFQPLHTFIMDSNNSIQALQSLYAIIKSIVHLHTDLLQLLQSHSNNQATTLIEHIATVFLHTMEYMKIYGLYCASYMHAKEELTQLQSQNIAFEAFILKLYENAKEEYEIDIISSLIKPVQRICRYPLLFRRLCDHVEGEMDIQIVTLTLQKIEEIAAYVNAQVRLAQNNHRLYQLYLYTKRKTFSKSHNYFLKPSRRFVGEVVAKVVNIDAPHWVIRLLSYLNFYQPRSNIQHRSRIDSFLYTILAFRKRQMYIENRMSLEALDWPTNNMLQYLNFNLETQESSSQNLDSQVVVDNQTKCSNNGTVLSTSPPYQSEKRKAFEECRLILLSDVLIMARKRTRRGLRIKREICLSCANIGQDDKWNTSTTFLLLVSKVGSCNCQQAKYDRFRQVGRCAARSSIRTAGHQQNIATMSIRRPINNRKFSLFGSDFQIPIPFRKIKRYQITCASQKEKEDFVQLLSSAIFDSKGTAFLPVQESVKTNDGTHEYL